MRIELDLWPEIAPLVPLLGELERIEALAAGKTEAVRSIDHAWEDDQRQEGQADDQG
jgi:hypothetical protein